jgi:siroheme synthase (precorrin-2 oxidase/ferrochelatase)/ferredoxin
MITLKIDNTEVTVKDGATVLEAAEQAGISIPTLCHYQGLEPFTSCMVCMVSDENGKLFPSCSIPAQEGMQVLTSGDEVVEARRTALELLLSEHVGDCEAPCVTACPAHMDIPLMNRLLAAGKTDEALAVVRNDIAMPATLGYICSAPCEGACKRKDVDEPVAICLLKRFCGTDGEITVTKTEVTGKNALVIGAGPAGLAAAYHLQTAGIQTTLTDKNSTPGGTLWSSVKENTLPKEILEKEIQFILSSGIILKKETVVSETELEALRKDFDCIIIATGENSHTFGLESNKQGIVVNRETFETGESGVFATGSVTRKTKLAIAALAQGKRAAKAAYQFLVGENITGETTRFNSKMGRLMKEEVSEYLSESVEYTRVNSTAEKGFTADEVRKEAARCMHCDCRNKEDCLLRKYSDEYGASQRIYHKEAREPIVKHMQHGEIIYEPAKCIKCGICVQLTAKHKERYGMTFIGRGFDVKIGVPFGKDTGEGLEKIAEDVVKACPVGALTIK